MITNVELNTIKLNSFINDAIEKSVNTPLEKALYNKSVADAIIFCETIVNDALIKSAKELNDTISYQKKFAVNEDSMGHCYINPITKDGIYYADGSNSYKIDTTIRYDFLTLVEYLTEHNILLSVEDSCYFHYGRGGLDCKTLTFYIKSV